ncbi:UPF0335 protein [Rickettsiales bacterium]|nr:UPF0335 protein [Rickettsiales bacterium]
MQLHGRIMPNIDSAAKDALLQFIEKIERLEEDKGEIQEGIKSVFAEARMRGFDVKIIRQILRLRKMNSRERQEQEALLDLYKNALGMLEDELTAQN